MSVQAEPETPLAAAMLAARDIMIPKTENDWHGVWLARVCRTTSHELGHCVGIGHCIYYSCAMQGSATVAEDIRQPPYLCPVCLKKVSYSFAGEPAIKTRGPEKEKRSLEAEAAWVIASYRKMSAYCEERKSVAMFGALHAWLEARLKELDARNGGTNGAAKGQTQNTEDEDEDEDMADDSSLIFMGSTQRN
jgi:archaemetzincin